MHPTMERVYNAFEQFDGFNPFKRQTSLGKLIDETNQTVKNWETRGVSKNAVNKIAKLYGLNPDWVMTGVGNMFLKTDAGTLNNQLVTRFVSLINFKDIDRFLSKGDGYLDCVISRLPCPVRHSDQTFAIALHTDHAGYLPNEIVFIDPTEESAVGDDVLAKIISEGQYNVLRKVSNDERGEQFLLALSESNLPKIAYMQDAKILGKAICAVRKL